MKLKSEITDNFKQQELLSKLLNKSNSKLKLSPAKTKQIQVEETDYQKKSLLK